MVGVRGPVEREPDDVGVGRVDRRGRRRDGGRRGWRGRSMRDRRGGAVAVGTGVVDAPQADTTSASATESAATTRFRGRDTWTSGSIRPCPRDGTASDRCGPASFAGTSQIRFGGSVAEATLSALRALPGGGLWLSRDVTPRRSGPTAAGPARRRVPVPSRPRAAECRVARARGASCSRSQPTISATISGPDGSLSVSWRRSG